MDLNLSGQEQKADQLRPKLVAFRDEIELRFPLWLRLSVEKRKKWVQAADAKDPLFALFVDIVRYARKWEVDYDD